MFLAQGYENKELIIFDDGRLSVADLVPDDERITYVRGKSRSTIGAKRNRACEMATGTFIAHWDDDDWYAPWRLAYQLSVFEDANIVICGLDRVRFFDSTHHRSLEYSHVQSAWPWLAGATLCYRKSLWERRHFAPGNVGTDARFVMGLPYKATKALENNNFFVGHLHPGTTVFPQIDSMRWRQTGLEAIGSALKAPWPRAATKDGIETTEANLQCGGQLRLKERTGNIYACLVHESPACIIDLVRNLTYTDPTSKIILYNGSKHQGLLSEATALDEYDIVIHPKPKALRWGRLHQFALDSMRLASDRFEFVSLTIVDSDQLSVREGYSSKIIPYFERDARLGMLSNVAGNCLPGTMPAPAKMAQAELDLWRPLLRRFNSDVEGFPRWTFWPGTVFSSAAAQALVDVFERDELISDILRQTRMSATEEVVFPTVTALLGFAVDINPCRNDYVRYQVHYSMDEAITAFQTDDVFWMHPVPRIYENQLRKAIRTHLNSYGAPDSTLG
jgi:hypothetical protein